MVERCRSAVVVVPAWRPADKSIFWPARADEPDEWVTPNPKAYGVAARMRMNLPKGGGYIKGAGGPKRVLLPRVESLDDLAGTTRGSGIKKLASSGPPSISLLGNLCGPCECEDDHGEDALASQLFDRS